jgi:hypothetical protein
MVSREITLEDLWQACRVCENSCRRMADVLGELIREADGAAHPLLVELPEAWPLPEPNGPCVPPGPCRIPIPALAEKAAWLAANATVLEGAFRALRDREPSKVVRYYTCVPSVRSPMP